MKLIINFKLKFFYIWFAIFIVDLIYKIYYKVSLTCNSKPEFFLCCDMKYAISSILSDIYYYIKPNNRKLDTVKLFITNQII